MKDNEEDPIDSAEFLLWKMKSVIESDRQDLDVGKLNFIIGDFLSKLSFIDPEIRQSLIERSKRVLRGHESFVDDNRVFQGVPNPVKEAGSARLRTKPHADVVILTVINTELEATLKTFGLTGTEPTFRIRGRGLYKCVLDDRQYGRRPINIYIAMVGEPRNVQCANICRDIAEELSVDLFVLCGIAGANRSSGVELVQTVAPYTVFYVEGGKKRRQVRLVGRFHRKNGSRLDSFIEKVGTALGYVNIHEPETLANNMTDPLKAYLQEFTPEQEAIKLKFRRVLESYSDDDIPEGTEEAIDRYQCHRDNLMCGEKVLANDGVRKISGSVNRKISAVDMESHGFAATCDHIQKQWIIFRGLSDYSDPKKDDNRHIGASISAAVSAFLFLTSTYVLPEERNEF